MDWKDLGQEIIKLGAPLLGAALGGPAGAQLGALVASAVGGNPQDPASILKAIQQSTDAATKLRELEMKHEEKILKLYMADVASARQREVDIVKATGEKDHFLYALAVVIVMGFFALCGLLMWRPLPEGSSQAVYLLFGGLVGGFSTILQYFFGSSKENAKTTNLLLGNKK